jgi:hypothetical protein
MVPSRFLLIIASSLNSTMEESHMRSERLDVTLLYHPLQAHLVVLSRPDTPPFVKPLLPASIFRGEVCGTFSEFIALGNG